MSGCDSPGGISAAGEMKLGHPDSLSPMLAGAWNLAPKWLLIFIFNINFYFKLLLKFHF